MVKLERVSEAATRGEWREALRLATKSRHLGAHRDTIHRAYSAMQRPDFYRDLGQEPQELIDDGIAALKARCEL